MSPIPTRSCGFLTRWGGPEITAAGEKIVDLPAGGYNNHWTRNIVANADGSKLYVSVGSATNVDEEGIDAKTPERAAILEINPDGSGKRIFASGLRNPNGMDWAPGTNEGQAARAPSRQDAQCRPRSSPCLRSWWRS